MVGEPPSEFCYLCALAISPADRDVEHIVPECLFNLDDRVNLPTLPAHRDCNRSYSKDEEYFRHCMTIAAPEDANARKIWSGPVMRGVHRLESRRFKASLLRDLISVNLRTGAGLHIGTRDAMLQDPKRIHRVIDKIVRGLYTHRKAKILPADWPVSSDLMDAGELRPVYERIKGRFLSFGHGTFVYDSDHLEEDDREALFWLVFYGAVHFWGYVGTEIRSRLLP